MMYAEDVHREDKTMNKTQEDKSLGDFSHIDNDEDALMSADHKDSGVPNAVVDLTLKRITLEEYSQWVKFNQEQDGKADYEKWLKSIGK